MKWIQVEKSGPLSGSLRIPGSKNSSQALLAASCLSDEIVSLEGIPNLNDYQVICQIGNDIGLKIERAVSGEVLVDPRAIHSTLIDPKKSSSFRASYYFVGALLAKFGKVTIGFPGGDDFTSRPIDQHIKAFKALGAQITFHSDHYIVEARKLKGAEIFFDMITSGATINSLLAAVRADGKTILRNAAKDPEVVDTANLLNRMGGKIFGAGTDTIRIEGVEHLNGCTHTVIPDRLIAGSFLIAAGITGGCVTVEDIIPQHLDSCVAKLREIGMQIESNDSSITAYATGAPKATRVRTGMYPAFATDLQQPLTALLAQAPGRSIITDKIFPKRFNHVQQLNKMGAKIEIRGESAFIQGGRPFMGTLVHASDVRAGTCLILAGLAAEGSTTITGVEHIERGNENIVDSFRSLGAKISLHHKNFPEELYPGWIHDDVETR